jgi:hypothetical protein
VKHLRQEPYSYLEQSIIIILGAHGLKTTRGMFEALSAAEIDDHSHSVFKGDKGFKSINDSECSLALTSEMWCLL